MPDVTELFFVDSVDLLGRQPALLPVVEAAQVGVVHVLPYRYMVRALARDLARARPPPEGYDVVCVGSAGERVYAAVRGVVPTRAVITADAWREFGPSFRPERLELGVAGHRVVLPSHAAASLHGGAELLLFDDVVYSGDTLRGVVDAIARERRYERVHAAALISLRTAAALGCATVHGTTCDRPALWPEGRTELVDLVDLVAPDALRFQDGVGRTLMDWLALTRDQLFGAAYEPVAAMLRRYVRPGLHGPGLDSTPRAAYSIEHPQQAEAHGRAENHS